jgi:hypothetical protein
MPGTPAATSKRDLAADLLSAELQRLGRSDLRFTLCFSDREWRQAMIRLGCPAYTARLASPTARRGTRGKLGMATICHFRHGHAGVVYIRIQGRNLPDISETVRHEALHLARPSYSHRQIETALHGPRRVHSIADIACWWCQGRPSRSQA